MITTINSVHTPITSYSYHFCWGGVGFLNMYMWSLYMWRRESIWEWKLRLRNLSLREILSIGENFLVHSGNLGRISASLLSISHPTPKKNNKIHLIVLFYFILLSNLVFFPGHKRNSEMTYSQKDVNSTQHDKHNAYFAICYFTKAAPPCWWPK